MYPHNSVYNRHTMLLIAPSCSDYKAEIIIQLRKDTAFVTGGFCRRKEYTIYILDFLGPLYEAWTNLKLSLLSIQKYEYLRTVGDKSNYYKKLFI